MAHALARIALVASLGIATLAAPASAQPKDDAAVARQLGREGIDLFARERWAEALEKLERAEAMYHAPTLLLYIARCRRNMGELVAARAHYEALVNEELPPDAPAQFRDAKDTAYRELRELDARIPSLLILGEVSGAVTIDGREVEPSGPIRLDPGEHVVSSGGVEREVTLAEGAGIVRLDLGGPAPEETPSDGGPGEPEEPREPDALAGEGSDGPLWPGITAVAVGGAGLGLGVVTGVMAMTKADDIKSRCVDQRCLTADAEQGEQAEMLATVSTVGFVVGGALSAAGVVLILWRPGGDEGAEVAARVIPNGLWLEGTF